MTQGSELGIDITYAGKKKNHSRGCVRKSVKKKITVQNEVTYANPRSPNQDLISNLISL